MEVQVDCGGDEIAEEEVWVGESHWAVGNQLEDGKG